MLILFSDFTLFLAGACAVFLVLWAILEFTKKPKKSAGRVTKGDFFVDQGLLAQMEQSSDPSLNVSFQLVELSSNVAVVRQKVELLHERLDQLEMRLPETSILMTSSRSVSTPTTETKRVS